jgi:rubrerythrin
MTQQSLPSEIELVAQLNDLLQLDHDAVQAYELAIESLDNASYRETLREFLGDHQRHITELTQLIEGQGGKPIRMAHIPTGAFKLAVQAVGALGGDRAVLRAFRANERQVRDKYRRVAREVHTADITSVLARAAEDEQRHYAWVLRTLEELSYDASSVAGRIEGAAAAAHQRVADVVEGAERKGMVFAERGRRGLNRVRRNPVRSALVAAGTAALAAFVITRVARR